MAFFKFDATQVAPQQSFGPVPPGEYIAHITESSLEDLNSGNGQGLRLTFEVLDGQHKGRRVWETLNVIHTSEKTQGIAQAQLSALCHAIGVLRPNDTAELHFKPVQIQVAVKEADGKYAARNTIKGYSSVTTNAPVAQAPAAATPAAQPAAPAHAAANSNVPAWAKRG